MLEQPECPGDTVRQRKENPKRIAEFAVRSSP
jgi:hypothetical protein